MATEQVFHGADREDMTPNMIAFEKWWSKNPAPRADGVHLVNAWNVWRNAWWACEEAEHAPE